MSSIKLKVFFLAASFFSFSAIFAQDSTNKPVPDTSKMPKHDSTSMIMNQPGRSVISNNVTEITASLEKKANKVDAKKEEKVS